MSEQGLSKFSIRSIAAQLSLSPMSVYRFVSSKDELLDLVLLRVLSRIEIPVTFEPEWEERIISIMSAWREMLLTHAEIVPLLLERPIPRGSEGLARLQEAILANLDAAGISGARAVRAFWQIFVLAVGQVMFDLPRLRLTEADMTDYASALSSVANERSLSRVSEMVEDLASMTGRGTFSETLRTLLRGISMENPQ
nr:TetR/AcrR family transcriptional regulator C-terminal domain-containing protein [Microbacterium pseudoresistens]